MPKFCSKCGSPIKEGSKFCRSCGAPVRQTGTAESSGAPAAEVLETGIKAATPVAKAEISLSLDEMLRGCTKVVDFGTGKKFEIAVPGGLTPGDTLVIEGTGIAEPETGLEYRIELSSVIE